MHPAIQSNESIQTRKMISKDVDWTIREMSGVSLHLGDQFSSYPRGPGPSQVLGTRVTHRQRISDDAQSGSRSLCHSFCAFLGWRRDLVKSDFKSLTIITPVFHRSPGADWWPVGELSVRCSMSDGGRGRGEAGTTLPTSWDRQSDRQSPHSQGAQFPLRVQGYNKELPNRYIIF